MIIESERSGKTISDVCIVFGVSRETWYKWKRRYDVYGIDGLKNHSRKPHNIKSEPQSFIMPIRYQKLMRQQPLMPIDPVRMPRLAAR